MIAPEAGQVVRLEGHDEKLIVKSVSADESEVELVAMADHSHSLPGVQVADLLPGEDLSAG